jgi:GT2 family glycosyltransferase
MTKGLVWNYGITTVPERSSNLLIKTIGSLANAGFDKPHIFVDGYDNLTAYRSSGLPVTVHSRNVRTTGHWILSLWELWANNPHADRYAIFQDDLVTYRNLREYLDNCLWPGEKSYLNLLTFRENHERLKGSTVGWHLSDQLGKGAVALVFDPDGVKSILSSPHLVGWIKDRSRGHRLVDRAISQSLKKLGFTEWIHNPSLVQHTGIKSSMGSDKHPLSTCFRGEDFNACDLLKGGVRESIQSGCGRVTIRVAVPAVDSFDLTHKCLQHLSHTEWPIVVDYIDNGSSPDVIDRVRESGERLGLPMNCVSFPENVGFTKAVNVSMKLAAENNQHCLILNNDCMVASDTVRRMYDAMMCDPLAAAVGPVTMDRGGQSLRHPSIRKESMMAQIPQEPSDVEAISKSLTRFRSRPARTLAFFCTLVRNTAIQKVGLLPVIFADGLGADDAWCHLARKAGLTVNVAHHAYAHHMHSQTFKRLGINRQKASAEAVKKLRKFN